MAAEADAAGADRGADARAVEALLGLGAVGHDDRAVRRFEAEPGAEAIRESDVGGADGLGAGALR